MCVSELKVLIRHLAKAVWLVHRLRNGLPFMRELSAPHVGEVRIDSLVKWMCEDRENYEWSSDLFRSACNWLRKRDAKSIESVYGPSPAKGVPVLDAMIAYSCAVPSNIEARRKSVINVSGERAMQFAGFPHNPNLASLDWCKKGDF